MIVTAYGDDTGGTDAGGAWLLTGSADGVRPRSELQSWAWESAGDYLLAAAGDGDLNGDGFTDLAFGAPGWDGTGVNKGAVWALEGPDLVRAIGDAEARIAGSSDGSGTGYAIGIVGDTNGDGRDDLAAGAPFDSWCGEGSGAVALFLGPVTGTMDLRNADACLAGDDVGDETGSAVAGNSDVDGNGTADLVVGAPAASDGRGTAWYIATPVVGHVDLTTVGARWKGVGEGDQAGWALAIGGDVNDDGLAEIAIGARGVGGGFAGSAYLVLGAGL